MEYNELTGMIIKTAIGIHRELGPGLLESAYQEILFYELKKQKLRVEKDVPVPVIWEDVQLDIGYIADLVVEDKIIVELKAVEKIANVHKKQLLTYLKVADKRLGLLINFNEVVLKDGITRIVNNLQE